MRPCGICIEYEDSLLLQYDIIFLRQVRNDIFGDQDGTLTLDLPTMGCVVSLANPKRLSDQERSR